MEDAENPMKSRRNKINNNEKSDHTDYRNDWINSVRALFGIFFLGFSCGWSPHSINHISCERRK